MAKIKWQKHDFTPFTNCKAVRNFDHQKAIHTFEVYQLLLFNTEILNRSNNTIHSESHIKKQLMNSEQWCLNLLVLFGFGHKKKQL